MKTKINNKNEEKIYIRALCCVLTLHSLPGRIVHRYMHISCCSDKLLLVIQKINLAVD